MTERYDPLAASFWEDAEMSNRDRAKRHLDRAEQLLDQVADPRNADRPEMERLAEADVHVSFAQVLLGVRYPL